MNYQSTFQRLTFLLLLVFSVGTAMAQYYNGEHTFDGENKNETSVSVTIGKNIITGPCIGNTVHYKHYFNDHWSVDDTLNPLPIALTSDTTVTAFFVALQSIPQIIDSAATFRLLPNPAKESVRCVILGNDLCGGLVSLSDAAGREMFRCQLLPGQRSVELRLKDCPKGAYFVSLTTPRGTSTQKLVVE